MTAPTDQSRGQLPAVFLEPEPPADRLARFNLACTQIAAVAALGLLATGGIAWWLG